MYAGRRIPLLPATPTDPDWKFSPSDVVAAGMSNSTQWVKPPFIGASGSCRISANDFVPAGASFHSSAGDGFVIPASHVYLLGIAASFVNAGLVRLKAAATTIKPTMTDTSCVKVSRHGRWS